MQSGSSRHFTEEEMSLVRETDLPELLSHLGYQVRRIGRYHTTAEMDSLRIKDRRTWFRYSENTGGDAIDFLRRFCEKSFPEAVEYLLAFHGRARDSPAKTGPNIQEDESPKPFALPPRSVDDRRVFVYVRKRGIAPQVIRRFLESGLLYEDAVHHNCVFVGRDGSGRARYAGLRGTYVLWRSAAFSASRRTKRREGPSGQERCSERAADSNINQSKQRRQIVFCWRTSATS